MATFLVGVMRQNGDELAFRCTECVDFYDYAYGVRITLSEQNPPKCGYCNHKYLDRLIQNLRDGVQL